MNRVLINGIGGQMGHALYKALSDLSDQWTIVGGVDPNCSDSFPFPVYASSDLIEIEPDVVIDFSVPAATEQILKYCILHRKPIVICTTALPDALIRRIEEASKTIPILRSGNMSLGISLMKKLIANARLTLGDAFDIEIIETHHNRKKDAPSGTAMMLADAIQNADQTEHPYVYGRSEKDRRRAQGEIGFHSVRGGTIVGEHEVRFLGTDEEIAVTHRAYSKRIFANGAIRAASFLLGKTNGLFTMDDLVSELVE